MIFIIDHNLLVDGKKSRFIFNMSKERRFPTKNLKLSEGFNLVYSRYIQAMVPREP